MDNFQDRGVWIRNRTGLEKIMDPDPTCSEIGWIRLALRGLIRIRSISDRIRNPVGGPEFSDAGHSFLTYPVPLIALAACFASIAGPF